MSVRRLVGRGLAATVAAVGGAALLRRRRRRRGDHRVFLLEYHDVCARGPEREGVVAAARLGRHVRFLRRCFRIESLSEAVDALAAPAGPTEDLAVVTFDDGYAGTYRHAWPVLREAGVPGVVFLTTGFLDGEDLWFDLAERCLEAARRPAALGTTIDDPDAAVAVAHWRAGRHEAARNWLKNLPEERRDRALKTLRDVFPRAGIPATPLSWAQVRELSATGFEIGAHTHSHPVLSTLSVARQREEILRSRDRIANELGALPRHFAYPNGAVGDFTDDTVRLVREAGFRSACTTMRGSNARGADLFRLARIGVGDEATLVLAGRLAGLLDEGFRQRFRSILADAQLAH